MLEQLPYKRELDFLLQFLSYANISCHIFSISDFQNNHLENIDFGLHKALGLKYAQEPLKKFFFQQSKNHTISCATDEFFTHYIYFTLPETNPAHILLIGPYIMKADDEHLILQLRDLNIDPHIGTLINDYYAKSFTPCNTEALNAALFSFADGIWGKENYQVEAYALGIPESLMSLLGFVEPHQNFNIRSDIEVVEDLSNQENALMQAISRGNATQAKTIFMNLPLHNFKQFSEPLMNLKYFTISINTLFRKSAEQGGVHPLYIEQVSNYFIQQISELTRTDNIWDLWNEMIQRYCSLVNNHITQSYSLPVQKIIMQVNLDPSSDLSLKAMAEYLDVNASYLSNLFHKETGETLTNYVNRKRMEYAAYLLSTTTDSISNIAQDCGILDDNYFTKLFKRRFEVTPTQFRDALHTAHK